MMKVIVKDRQGKMIKLGESVTKSDWYYLTDAIKPIIGNFNQGDDVEVVTTEQDGAKYLTSISKKTATNPTVTPTPTPKVEPPKQQATGSTQNNGNSFAKTEYLPREQWEAKMKAEGKWDESKSGFSPEKNASIRSQAIGKMTAQTISGMQGIIDSNNLLEWIDKIYAKYNSLIK